VIRARLAMLRAPRGPAVMVALVALLCATTAAAAGARTITRAQAAGVAAAISLRHGDLPALVASANPVTAKERQEEAQNAACDGGVPDTSAWAQAQSQSFDSPSSASEVTSISSATLILPSTQLVAKDLAAVQGPRGLPCLRSELATELGRDGTVSLVGRRAAPVLAGTFTLRFTATLSVKQGSGTVKVPLYADVIGFTHGQAEVSLNVVQSSVRPTVALEKRLAGLLVARAKAALG
jgi:hypothetical protein